MYKQVSVLPKYRTFQPMKHTFATFVLEQTPLTIWWTLIQFTPSFVTFVLELKKWSSNSQLLMSSVTAADRATDASPFNDIDNGLIQGARITMGFILRYLWISRTIFWRCINKKSYLVYHRSYIWPPWLPRFRYISGQAPYTTNLEGEFGNMGRAVACGFSQLLVNVFFTIFQHCLRYGFHGFWQLTFNFKFNYVDLDFVFRQNKAMLQQPI